MRIRKFLLLYRFNFDYRCNVVTGSEAVSGGGSVNGAVYGCDLNNNPILGGPNWAAGTGAKDGALYSADRNVGYLKRVIDYRSVVGEVIRDHLGATPDQLSRIIPAYGNESVEHLKSGGMVGTTPIIGELGIV